MEDSITHKTMDELAPIFAEMMNAAVYHVRKKADKTYIQLVFEKSRITADLFYEFKGDLYRIGELERVSKDHHELARIHEDGTELADVYLKIEALAKTIPHEEFDGYRIIFDQKTENMSIAFIQVDPDEIPVEKIGEKWMEALSSKPTDWNGLLRKNGLKIEYV